MPKRKKQLKKVSKWKKFAKFSKKNAFNLALIGFTSLGLAYFSLPNTAKAYFGVSPEFDSTWAEEMRLEFEVLENQSKSYGELPLAGDAKPRYETTVPTTAYTSTVWQCDDTPFITASGTHVRHGVVAANFLPIGTKLKIPELYGDQVFIVEDRMNARYYKKMDIWMEDYDEAIAFGVQNLTIQVF